MILRRTILPRRALLNFPRIFSRGVDILMTRVIGRMLTSAHYTLMPRLGWRRLMVSGAAADCSFWPRPARPMRCSGVRYFDMPRI